MRRQITLEQRYQIAALLAQEVKLSRISALLDFHVSTIYRELTRNSKRTVKGDVYDPDFAHQLCRFRHKLKAKHKRFTPSIRRVIHWLIKHKWSPEQIVCICKKRSTAMVSIESIYKYLYLLKRQGEDLCVHLRRHHRTRRKRAKNKQPRQLIKDRVSIHQRPQSANRASRVGHMEVDLMKCKNGYLLTMTDRKTLYNIIRKLRSKNSEEVLNAIKQVGKEYDQIIKTVTSDNGLEFAKHKAAQQCLHVKWFFADPYRSQQRGCNENQNGLIRQYFKRDTDLNLFSKEQILNVQKALNYRPRKKINFNKPIDMFKNQSVAFIC